MQTTRAGSRAGNRSAGARRAVRSVAVGLGLLGVVATGCGTSQASGGPASSSALPAVAGPALPAGSASAGASAALVAQGQAAFAQFCATCHGADLRGSATGPSLLSIVYEPGHHPDASFRTAIRSGTRQHHWGFGDMAPVPGVSDAEVEAVIAYVRAEQARQGFEPYPPRP